MQNSRYFSAGGVVLALTQYLQFVLGYSPLRAGAAFIPMMVTAMVFNGIGVLIDKKLGTRAALALHLSARVARETVDAILEAQELERTRIARELHDEMGSALTTALLGLTAIDGTATLGEARQASAELRETARNTLENVARMAFDLRP